jgi:hypothetical protein
VSAHSKPPENATLAEVWEALDKLVGLQAHYARLLNHYDCGERQEFKTGAEWLARLREIEGLRWDRKKPEANHGR